MKEQSGKTSAPQPQAHHVMPAANRTPREVPKRNLVPAGPCPASDNHKNTFVYSTKGRTRNCKCNDCGATWKQSGPFADPAKELMMSLAEMLAQTERREAPGGEKVIVLRAIEVDEICKQLTLMVEAG